MNELLERLRYSNFVRLPSSLGIVPVKALEYRYIAVSLVRLPSSEGIVPVSELLPKCR